MKNQFDASDYSVLGFVIIFSLGIGIWSALSGGRQKTTSEYLLGNRLMNFVPVAVSLMASYLSAITVLGTSSEVMYHGTQQTIYILSHAISGIIVAVFFVPVLYPLRLTSINQALD